MESRRLQPSKRLVGTCTVPGDKSISHRAVILGALSSGPCSVDNFLVAEDCLRTVEAFRQLGVKIEREDNHLVIQGRGLRGLVAPRGPIDCGNSGTTTRLLMGVLTGHPFEVQLHGDESLSRRPMDRVIAPLSRMGASFRDSSGTLLAPSELVSHGKAHLPLRIIGTKIVQPIHWTSAVASAQVKSAVLLAGLYAAGSTAISEPALSRDHTERMLLARGVSLERMGLKVVLHGAASIRAHSLIVPGDLSSAAFFLAAGILLGNVEVVVKGVGINPTRTGFLDIVNRMGAACSHSNLAETSGEPVADISAKRSSLQSTAIEGEVIPRMIDEIPILTVLASQARGQTVISNAQELRVKESDRLATLREELTKMGAQIEERPDGLRIEGPTPLKGAVVKSHGDHRLAMSLAIAALVAEGETVIEDVACVATSFPNFWKELDALRRGM